MSRSDPPRDGENKGSILPVTEPEDQLAQNTEVVARVRHEMNNVLTGLIGQAQLLQRENLSETAQRRVKTIEELAVRIKVLADQLRDA